MRVLLGLGDVELAPADVRDGLRERVGDLGRERDADRQSGLVLGHRDDQHAARERAVGRAIEGREVGVRERMRELARSVGAVVAVDERIAVADGAVDPIDDGGLDELVVLAPFVRRLDGCERGRSLQSHAVDDRVVAALRPVPALVAVHRVVAATDARDARVRVDLGEPRLEVRHEHVRRSRRRVPAVEQGVNADLGHAAAGREIGDGHEMAVGGVDAAGPDQAQEVESAAGSGRPIGGLEQRGPPEERAVVKRGVDALEVRKHRPAGAEVEVTDLGVSHLAGRQAHGAFGRPEPRVRPRCEEAPPDRQVRVRDRVARRVGPDAEAVEDHEDDRTGPAARPSDRVPRHDAGVAACRARAVRPARATIPDISSGLSEAPPTSAPSIDGSFMNSAKVALVTLPP